MASNVGITLDQIRNGTAVYQYVDSTTSVPGVVAVQKALQLLGYYGVNTTNYDGAFGNSSVAAAKGFQTENSLPVTGEIDQKTLSLIDSKLLSIYAGHSTTPTRTAVSRGFDYVNIGCSGDVVSYICSMLKSKGYTVNNTTSYTKDLATTVASFQSANNLNGDGIVGQQTYLALQNTTSETGWLSSAGEVSLTAGLLARCGFAGVLLNFYVAKLNSALNTFNINSKEKVKQFLAQCMAETASGRLLVEAGYKAGIGMDGKKYSPWCGAGFIHLTWEENYTKFSNYMKNTMNIYDSKILTPPAYATQHVAIEYPGYSAGWFWDVLSNLNSNSVINWDNTSEEICRELTKKIYGSYDTSSTRYGYYKQIGMVLK